MLYRRSNFRFILLPLPAFLLLPAWASQSAQQLLSQWVSREQQQRTKRPKKTSLFLALGLDERGWHVEGHLGPDRWPVAPQVEAVDERHAFAPSGCREERVVCRVVVAGCLERAHPETGVSLVRRWMLRHWGGNSKDFFCPKTGPSIIPKTSLKCHLKSIHT